MTCDPLHLLPISAARAADGVLVLEGCSLADLASRAGWARPGTADPARKTAADLLRRDV